MTQREIAESTFFDMIASEHREMFGASAQLAARIESFGDIPLVVIASGVPNPMFGDVAAEYQRFWQEQSRLIAGKSSQGQFVVAEHSTHALHLEAEDLVAQSIRSVMASARRQLDARE